MSQRDINLNKSLNTNKQINYAQYLEMENKDVISQFKTSDNRQITIKRKVNPLSQSVNQI